MSSSTLSLVTSGQAAIYCRISKDAEADGLGVARQEYECRELAARHGLTVEDRHVFIDNDISASGYSSKRRPAYEALSRAIEDGTVTVVLTWAPDRLYRQIRDLERYIEICTNSGDIPTLSVSSGHIDLSTASGRMQARILAAADAYESDRKSERTKAKHRELARNGAWMSGPKAYGYQVVFGLNDKGKRHIAEVKIVPEQAKIIREATRRLLAGDGLHTIAKDLNRRKIPAAKGGNWRPNSLRQILCAARNAGLREHTPGERGTAHPNANNLTQGNWKPIITVQQWQAIQNLLSNPARTTTKPGGHLLTGGIATCGLCGNNLYRSQRAGKNLLACRPTTVTSTSCGRIAATMSHVDEHITNLILDQMIHDTASTADTTASDLTEARQRLTDAAQDHADGIHDDITYHQIIRPKIETTIRGIEANRGKRRSTGYPQQRPALDQWWATQTLEQRRTLIKTYISRVAIHKPTTAPGSHSFDPNRLTIDWRQQPGASAAA